MVKLPDDCTAPRLGKEAELMKPGQPVPPLAQRARPVTGELRLDALAVCEWVDLATLAPNQRCEGGI